MEIRMIKEVNMANSTFIEGFPGIGLVGPMAVSYMIDKLKMDYVGYIESDGFPPIISIHAGNPMPPMRIYFSKEFKIVSIFAEFAIPIHLIHELSDKIYQFIRDNKIVKIIGIGGFPAPQPDSKVLLAIMSDNGLINDIKKSGMEPILEGVSAGVGPMLILKAQVDKIPSLNILVPVDQNIIDPLYAEVAITAINKLMDLNIDITELDKEAKLTESKVRELLKKSKESHESYKKVLNDNGPSMYA